MKRVSLGWLLVITCLNPTRLVASPPPANQLEEIRRILRQASQLIESIPERDQPSAASNIANTQARAGDLSGALATAHQLKTAEALAQTLGSIAYAVDYAGNVDGALSLIKDSVDGQAKNSSYEMVAEAHANKGDFSGALKIAHLIEHEPSRLQEALTRIAKTQWESGDHAAAQRTFDEAFDVVEQARKNDPNSAIWLLGIATAQYEIRETSAASTTLSYFAALIDQSKDPAAKGNLLPSLAVELAQIGEVARALRVIDEVPSGTNCDVALQIISSQSAKSGDMRVAMETISRISDTQLRGLAVRGIVALQGSYGNSIAAIETANSIPTAPGRAYALSTLALQQAEKGDDAAWRTVELAWEAANNSAANMPTYVFEEIAVTRAMLGDFSGARQIMQSLEPEARVWSLWNITKITARVPLSL